MHPLRIGALYGLIAAVLTVGGFELNHTAFGSKGNGIIGFLFGFLLPIVALYLAGHYAGRHERFQLSTAVTGGFRSTLHGTGAGAIAGLVFLILTQLAQKLPLPVAMDQLQSLGALGTLLGAGLFVLSLIGWFVGGTLLGTIGGAIGDGQAHRELKSGKAVPAATTK
jgi:hypothetical protein